VRIRLADDRHDERLHQGVATAATAPQRCCSRRAGMIAFMRSLGGVALSLLLLASGCAWGSDPGDSEHRSLGPDTPWGATAEGWQRQQVRCDGEGDLVVSFTPPDVTVSRRGDDLAHASLDGRSLSNGCVRISASNFVVRGSPPVSDPVYGNAELECRVPTKIVVQVHPIMESGEPAGSVLLLVRPDRHTVVASVPLKKGGSRLYFDTSACTRLS
jgi:hypothetical protein